MKHKTITDWNKLNGTSGQGEIETTRGHLVKAFGEPVFEELSGDKVTIEWDIEFEDGTIATIYDYKREGSGYYGGEGFLLDDFEPYEFSIGGNDKRAVELVTQALASTPATPVITKREYKVIAVDYRLDFQLGDDVWTWKGSLADNCSESDWYLNKKITSAPDWADDLDLMELAGA